MTVSPETPSTHPALKPPGAFLFSEGWNRFLTGWGLAAALLFVVDGYMISITPEEKVMGLIQKIFYIHLPSAWCAFLAFFVVFVAGLMYLITRKALWDALGAAGAEMGLVFTSITLLTGSTWARSAWGVWWTWDVRLTTTLILWFIYVGYLILRKTFEGSEKQAPFCAAYGMLGFLDVPIIHISIKLTETQHPAVLKSSGGGGLDPSMRSMLLWSSLIYLFGFGFFLLIRWREGLLAARFEALAARRMRRQ